MPDCLYRLYWHVVFNAYLFKRLGAGKMRKIKFRAWDKKHMAYQGTPDLETLHSFMFHYGDKILMQYTGLTDKNGKEIYEGDIVKWGKIIEKVEMKDGCWSMVLGTIVEEFNLEVIGNIYENPELIKGRKVRRTCTKMY